MGTLKLASNAVTATTASTDCAMYHSTSSAVDDSQVTIGTVGGADGGPALFDPATGNGYVCAINGSNIAIYKFVGGAFSSFVATAAGSWTTGDTVRLRRSGGNLLADKNGANVITQAEGTYTSLKPAIHNFDGTQTVTAWTDNASSGPSISSASTTSPIHGNVCTLTGSGFGAAQGTKQLLVGGIPQSVQSWSDTSIRFAVYRGTNKYGTSVNAEIWDAGALVSNSFALSGGLQPPTGWAFVNIGTPNTTASNRLTASPDLASGDQVAYDANGRPSHPTIGARVTVATDGTFTADPVNSFDFEVWSSNAWGLTATQTINALLDTYLWDMPEDSDADDVRLRDPTLNPAVSGAALTGVNATGSVGTFGVTATTALAGNAATGALGTLNPVVSQALTGNAATGSVGTLGVAVSAALSGQAATGAVGTFGAAASTALAGNVATGALGTFGLTVATALSGNAATGAVGTLTPSSTGLIELPGNAATGSVGTFGVTVSTALAGNAATGAVGSLAASAATALTGNAATGNVGSLAASVVVALSGNTATGATGTLTPQVGGVQIALSGVSAAGALGAFGLAATTALSGNAATAATGSVTAAALRALSGNGASGAVGSFQAFMQVVLSGVSATGGLGNLLPPNTVQIALSGVSGTGRTGELGLRPTADGTTRMGRRTANDAAERIGPEVDTVLAYRIGS